MQLINNNDANKIIELYLVNELNVIPLSFKCIDKQLLDKITPLNLYRWARSNGFNRSEAYSAFKLLTT